MRLPLVATVILIAVGLLIDYYIYRVISHRSPKRKLSKLHLAVSLLLLSAIIITVSLPRKTGSDNSLLCIMWALYAYLSIYIPKILFVVIDIIASIPRLFRRHRWKWLSATGAVAAIVLFAAMWWGALVNRFNINVEEVDITVENLPDGFDGYRIVQFSDLHTGTFGSDTTFVSRLVDKLNSLDGDIIVFTGDIVNRNSQEMAPFTGPLSRLSAPDGVYAILGNHDYGDYMKWKTPADKDENMAMLYRLYDSTGIDLLRNETRIISHGNDSIALIGVENIGDPPFKVYGSLAKAYPNAADSTVKILLTHNPAHWTDSIMNNPTPGIGLTLSGHTHAMQIRVAGMTPASLRYSTPGGLYSDSLSQKLYVNIGAGTVGIPMRLGATPEITILTLRQK